MLPRTRKAKAGASANVSNQTTNTPGLLPGTVVEKPSGFLGKFGDRQYYLAMLVVFVLITVVFFYSSSSPSNNDNYGNSNDAVVQVAEIVTSSETTSMDNNHAAVENEKDNMIDEKTDTEEANSEEENSQEQIKQVLEEQEIHVNNAAVEKNDPDDGDLDQEVVEEEEEEETTTTATETKKYQQQQQPANEENDPDLLMAKTELKRNGCSFGWHSPSTSNSLCYHVSLIPHDVKDAELKCLLLGNTPLMKNARLGDLRTKLEVDFACSILARGNNAKFDPDRMYVAFHPDSALYDEATKKAFSAKPKSALSLLCNRSNNKAKNIAVLRSNEEKLPFLCVAEKQSLTEEDFAGGVKYEEDSFENEIPVLETTAWTKMASPTKDAKEKCVLPRDISSPQSHHHAVLLKSLPIQIQWKITTRRLKGEPTRYYAVWQSKSWYGWLDFWVEHLVKTKDFKVAPVGKNVVVSRSASGRTGYTGIFIHPSTAAKYGVKLVLSRLPVPAGVLTYFPNGTLVNQVYTDPLVRVPLGDKLQLVRVLDEYAKQHLQCGSGTMEELRIMPQSFDVSTREGCLNFVTQFGNTTDNNKMEIEPDKSKKKMQRKSKRKEEEAFDEGDILVEDEVDDEVKWVVKGPLHGGAQVSVFNTNGVIHRLNNCEKEVLDREELVQRLVSDTLIFDGKKFDLRVFVLIASTNPLLVYVHKEPYFRASMKKLIGHEEADKNQLVTNTHIQKKGVFNFTEKDWQNHLWTPDKVKTYAERVGIPSDFWERFVFPRIKRSVRMVIQASAHTLVDRRAGQFKLFGVDFVIDANLKPLLLDWNAFPGWDWSYRLSWTLKYRRKVLDDMWKLVLDVQRGAGIAEARDVPVSGGFELVFHGKHYVQ